MACPSTWGHSLSGENNCLASNRTGFDSQWLHQKEGDMHVKIVNNGKWLVITPSDSVSINSLQHEIISLLTKLGHSVTLTSRIPAAEKKDLSSNG